MQELPSKSIKRWVADVQAGADKAAAAAAAAKKRIAATSGGDAQPKGTKKDKAVEKRRERMKKELEILQAKLAGERALENMHYINQIKRLQKFRENKLITEQKFNELAAKAKSKHEKELTAIQKREQDRRDKFTEKSYATQVGMVAGSLKEMTSTVGTENKKMFKLTQAAAIASAIVSAYEGIAKTLATYPYPLSIAMAAAQAIAAFAQVKAIKSQSVGGGGGGSGGGGGGSASTGAGAQAQQQQEQRREATINVQGDSFGGETISRLAEEMGDFLTDGGRLGRVNVQRS